MSINELTNELKAMEMADAASKGEKELMLYQLADMFEEAGDVRAEVLRGLIDAKEKLEKFKADMHSLMSLRKDRRFLGDGEMEWDNWDEEGHHIYMDNALFDLADAVGFREQARFCKVAPRWYS